MKEFNREPRYVVVKISDINAAECTQDERDSFNVLCDKVALFRASVGKSPLECVVVEKDWPEYEPTWAAIQNRVEGKHPLALGAPFGGGFFGGEIMVNGERFALVVAPKAEGEKLELEYKLKARDVFDSTASDDDGLANTDRINDENHPAAHFCRSLHTAGYNDWYLPSRDELAMLCRNLGPTRKTTPDLFKTGGAEAFEGDWYWSSTEYAPGSYTAWIVDFGNGYQNGYYKYNGYGVRAVRRLKI